LVHGVILDNASQYIESADKLGYFLAAIKVTTKSTQWTRILQLWSDIGAVPDARTVELNATRMVVKRVCADEMLTQSENECFSR
jgi:hypothetical protein